MAAKPFDAATATPWTWTSVDPASLYGRKDKVLGENRLETQRELLRAGLRPDALMAVTTDGVVLEGHHRCRVAWQFGESVTLLVCDFEAEKGLPVTKLPVKEFIL